MDTQAVKEETLVECKDLKCQCTHYTEMYLAFILNYLEIQFSTACFICVCIFFPKMRQKIISPKATVDTVSQGNIPQNPKSNLTEQLTTSK